MYKKILLGVAVIGVLSALAIRGTGAFFSDSATATANVFTAGTLDLQLSKTSGTGGFANTQSSTWVFNNMAPGGTPSVDTLWLKNVGSVDGMHLDISAANTESVAGIAQRARITQMTLDGRNLLKGGAGATIEEYQEPTGCTVTATPGNLPATVAAAAAGSVVCVDSGAYSPGAPLALSTNDITLVGLHDPNGAGAAAITGEISVTGNRVTVRGLNITNPSGGYGVSITGGATSTAVRDNVIHDIGTALTSGSAQAVSIQNGAAGGMGYTISGNRIYNVGNTGLVYGSSGSAKGIYLGDTDATGVLNGVTIQNNEIHHIQASGAPYTAGRGAYGILTNVNAGVTGLVIKNNSIYDLDGLWSHAIGLERLTNGALVTYNDIHDLVNHKAANDSVAVQVEDNLGTGITVQYNNLLAAYGVTQTKATGGAIDATRNWWGDWDPSDNIFTAGPTINTANFAGGVISGLVNGTDYNGNDFADLDDLIAAHPLVGAEPGLNGGQVREFVMGVQYDGPTTDNTFKNASLTTNLTFTLNQI